MSTHSEIVAHLGRMVRAERARLGYTSVEKAATAAGMKNYKTLSQFELGRTMPNATNRSLIEDLLMWKDGSMTAALGKQPDEVTFDTMRDWEKEEPVSAASELTTDELLVELVKRMGELRLLVAAAEQITGAPLEVNTEKPTAPESKLASGGADFKGTPAQVSHQNAYDLAAHTPRGGKKVDPRKATRK